MAATKLALRRAFPDSTQATAVVRETPPRVSGEMVEQVASEFGSTAMSGPLTLVSGAKRAQLAPTEYAPFVSVVPDDVGPSGATLRRARPSPGWWPARCP